MKKLLFLLFVLIFGVQTLFPLADSSHPITAGGGFKKIRNGQLLLRYNVKGELVEQQAFGIEQLIYGENDELYMKVVNVFDENGNKKESLNYDENGEQVSKWAYKTNFNGSIKEMSNKSETIEFSYSLDGKVLLVQYDDDFSEFEYNEDGTLKGMKEGEFSHKYIYDKNKVLLKKEFFYGREKSYVEEYVYDDEGYIKESLFYIITDRKKEFFSKTVYVYR